MIIHFFNYIMGFGHVPKFKQQKTPLKLIRGVTSIKKGNSDEHIIF